VAAPERHLFSVEIEDGRALEDQIELLLAALRLVVCLDEDVAGVLGDEDVGAERVDSEGMLQRVPRGITRLAV
jgi:hypothetical protein